MCTCSLDDILRDSHRTLDKMSCQTSVEIRITVYFSCWSDSRITELSTNLFTFIFNWKEQFSRGSANSITIYQGLSSCRCYIQDVIPRTGSCQLDKVRHNFFSFFFKKYYSVACATQLFLHSGKLTAMTVCRIVRNDQPIGLPCVPRSVWTILRGQIGDFFISKPRA